MFGFGKSGIDAIALLKADHRTIEQLFAAFERTSNQARRRELATRLCHELVVHAKVEEELLYPQALAAFDPQDHGLIWEATVEHGTLSGLIEGLADQQDDNELFASHVRVLKEYVKHHVESEEHDLFPRLRACRIDLAKLGEQIAARRAVLLESLDKVEAPAAALILRSAA
jgi:hemerythrin superfamily protein